jgi:hypothetical protein
MEIYITKNNTQMGPYDIGQITKMQASGALENHDFYWHEGMSEWMPLSQMIISLQGEVGAATSIAAHMQSINNPVDIKTSGFAITSLVLGILSVVTCLFFLGIPAVIFGHLARGKIRKNTFLVKGKGMALAGLIMGYTAIAMMPLAIIASLALPAVTGAQEKGKCTQQLSNGRQVYILLQSASLDAAAKGTHEVGFPADIKAVSLQEVCDSLVSHDYIKQDTLKNLLEGYEMGNVSSEDPPKTILLRSMPKKPNDSVNVVTISGECITVKKGSIADKNFQLPPRTPEFLK